MAVEVAPTIVKRERHGAILAVVHAVEDFPSTRSGMMQVLHNEELVDALLRRDRGRPDRGPRPAALGSGQPQRLPLDLGQAGPTCS